jgi:putative acetyltransferase
VSRGEIVVRHETGADWPAVEGVVRQAFGRADEARLVAALRGGGGVLSLVAVVEGRIVGQAMFSPVSLRGAERTAGAGPTAAPPARGLAPIAVAREWQRRGVGARLVREGLTVLRREGVGVVVVLGDPGYYARFGFVAGAHHGLRCKWGGDEGAFQVLELIDGAAAGYRGMVDYPAAFDELG